MANLSVLVLSYNHAAYIENAILSCRKQTETFDKVEVLVIDDGSSDNTKNILEKLVTQNTDSFCLKAIFNEHEGVKAISRNFNKLISLASNEYVAFLASDDALLPNAFSNQLEIFKKDSSVQLIYADGYNLKENVVSGTVNTPKTKSVLSTCDAKVALAHVLSEIPRIYIQSVIVRASFIKEFKPFDEDLIADDWVFNINCFKELCKKNLKFNYIDKPIFNRNILEGSTSKNYDVHFARIEQVARRYVANDNKKFYIIFYLKFIRHFGKTKKFFNCFQLFVKILLVLVGSKKHLKGLT